VLEIRDVEMPALGEDDVLVRTHATSLNPADWHLTRGEPQIARLQIGLRRPKHPVLGCDVAGRVEAVGGKVGGFAPGDDVLGYPFPECGAFAEYVRVPAEQLARPSRPPCHSSRPQPSRWPGPRRCRACATAGAWPPASGS
jgi:NADPH:quinone reductase-like Zn-dependent oxidoreductase